jgi:hypothetical protein
LHTDSMELRPLVICICHNSLSSDPPPPAGACQLQRTGAHALVTCKRDLFDRPQPRFDAYVRGLPIELHVCRGVIFASGRVGSAVGRKAGSWVRVEPPNFATNPASILWRHFSTIFRQFSAKKWRFFLKKTNDPDPL